MDDCFTIIGDTVAIAGTTTASAAVPLTDPKLGSTERNLRLLNEGPDLAFFALGGSTITAAIPVNGAPANGVPLPKGEYSEPFRITAGVTHASVVTASGTAVVYFTSGKGS